MSVLRTPSTGVEIRSDALGGSSLARLVAAGDAPADWHAARPADPTAWRARITQVSEAADTGWLAALSPAFDAGGAAAARLARVAAQHGVVVTTGQQPGLFGGPLYTWYKALSALALADALESATGLPVAPVFWAATDDADFAEAAETWIADDTGAHRLALAPRDTGGRPMADVMLGALDAQLDTLARAAGSAAHGDVLGQARAAYRAGASVGDAYVGLLRAVLEPLGIAVLDASHDAVRERSDSILRAALRAAESVDAAVRARAGEIERAGHVAQVPPVDGLSLVQAHDAHGGKGRVPITDAARTADDAAARLGGTVLLRPVVERAILPTVAYVAGPGELAYFAQVSAVADALDVARPLAVPRWSATLVEPRIRRVLDRLAMEVDAFADPHAPERALAQASLPPAVVAAFTALREDVARAAADLAAAGVVPSAVPDGFLRDQMARIDRLERRHRAAMRRHEAARFADLAVARGALRPGGLRQERALNLLPLLARHGTPLLAELRSAAATHAQSLVGAPMSSGIRARDGAHGT